MRVLWFSDIDINEASARARRWLSETQNTFLKLVSTCPDLKNPIESCAFPRRAVMVLSKCSP
jgi:hypothetical protein